VIGAGTGLVAGTLGAGSRDVGNPATLEGVAGESGRLGLPFAVKPVGHGTLTAH